MKKFLLLVFVALFFSQKICWGYTHYPDYENYSSELQDTLKDFRKFLDVDGLRERAENGWSIYYGIFPKDFLGVMIDYKLFPFVERGYAVSSNKTVFLQFLSQAFGLCSQWTISSLKNVCDHYFYDLIGPRVQISQLSFSGLQKVISTGVGLKERSHELDFDEHYVSLPHKDTVITEEYALGEYLLGIGIAPEFSDVGSPKQNFIYILKAGDTHWQPFVSIIENTSASEPSKKRLDLIHQKLNLFISFPQRDEHMFYLGNISPDYELQKDGSWKLKACFEEKEVCLKNGDCKLQQKKLPLKQCEKFGISLTTVLGK